MDSITNKLNNIIICAGDIKEEITENWHKLFMGDNGQESFDGFNEDADDIYNVLSNLRDAIYEILED